MEKYPYENTDLPTDVRVDDLISRMTIGEKISQMVHDSPAIPRLNIPEYNWWNEGLHGVARAGTATVFPQAIGLAASFDEELLYKVADVISTEARAKFNAFSAKGDRGIYKGLTIWSPNVNIFRDPRWGRGHETYGEDPYLTGRLGVSFIRGLQGTDEKYLKTVATPKHFAVHSGPEGIRENFNAKVGQRDLWDTYLPAFKECIKEGGAQSIMGAYNFINGKPCCASSILLEDILRDEWGFEGFVVSDCGALCNFHLYQGITQNAAESSALAIANGLDLNCGDAYNHLTTAVAQGLVSEEQIDRSLKRLLTARFKLGMFDPPEEVEYTNIPYDVVDCEAHRRFSKGAAQRSMVLLKNNGILPLSKEIASIAVIGPNALNHEVLLGNYNGWCSKYSTPVDGIREKVSADTRVYYAKGCDVLGESIEYGNDAKSGMTEAIIAAERADVTVLCLGLSPRIEGEAGDAYNSDAGGDRISIELPKLQQKLLEEVYAVSKSVIVVLISGGPLAVNWAQRYADAIIQAWYPGQEGGAALADILFGDYNPSAKLPITFYRSIDDLPDFEDYSMEGRTYRYMECSPLYPFGFGLSYTDFEYKDLKLDRQEIEVGQTIELSVTVKNTGLRAGEETVQLYIKDVEASCVVPRHKLVGIAKVYLEPGQQEEVQFTLTPRQMALIDDSGNCILEPGEFKVYVGGNQPDGRSQELGGKVLDKSFEVFGHRLKLEY